MPEFTHLFDQPFIIDQADLFFWYDQGIDRDGPIIMGVEISCRTTKEWVAAIGHTVFSSAGDSSLLQEPIEQEGSKDSLEGQDG